MISSQTDPFEVGMGLQSARQNLRTKWEELKAPSEKSAHRKDDRQRNAAVEGGWELQILGCSGRVCIWIHVCGASIPLYMNTRMYAIMSTCKPLNSMTESHTRMCM